MNTAVESQVQEKNKKLLVPLVIIAVGMLAFGVFVMPPLYNMICAYVGVDLNPDNTAQATPLAPGERAPIKVSFNARVLDNLPVRFFAEKQVEKIMPGETGYNVFHFENLSNDMVYFRPLHTVSPSFAASVFDMKVCFCFNDQALKPGEKKSYEIQYSFGSDLDVRVSRAIVSYDLHKITKERMKPFKAGNTKVVDPEQVRKDIEEAAKQ